MAVNSQWGIDAEAFIDMHIFHGIFAGSGSDIAQDVLR
jgi:hypothetical protein